MIDTTRVDPGSRAQLAARDPSDTLDFEDKAQGERSLDASTGRIGVLQQRLYAEGTRSVLLVLQGMDGSGKDGVIRRAFHGVGPLGTRVSSFKEPSPLELGHDYLWRIHAACPLRGEIGIFNRSHLEDIVAVSLHRLAPEAVWRRRAGHIREWERMLTDEGTEIVKVFLNVSREEQAKRFEERLADPEKRWKFRRADLEVNRRYDEYLAAYEEAITATSTAWAPWHVVPADRNWLKAAAVARLVVAALERLDPQLPEAEPG